MRQYFCDVCKETMNLAQGEGKKYIYEGAEVRPPLPQKETEASLALEFPALALHKSQPVFQVHDLSLSL